MPNKKKDVAPKRRLTSAECQEMYDQIERSTPQKRRAQSRPPTRAEQAMFDRIVRKMGRPRLGKNGTRQVSITVEIDLLTQADAFARAAGMNRSEMISRGLRRVLEDAA